MYTTQPHIDLSVHILGRQQACVDVSIQRHTGGQREAVGVVLAVAGSASGQGQARGTYLEAAHKTTDSQQYACTPWLNLRSSLHLRATGGDTIRCRRPSL